MSTDAGFNPNAPACGGVSRLADDFSDGIWDDDVWGAAYADAPASYREQDGHLVITPADNMMAKYAGYTSQRFYDLREQRIVTRVTQFPAAAALVGMHIRYETTTYIGMTVSMNQLRVDQRMDTMFMTPASIAFEPDVHKYFAVSERAGRVYFETSTDGVAFEAFHDMVPPFPVNLVRVTLYAGTNEPVATPGEARFDFVAASGAQPAACPVASVSDDFQDGFEGRQWDLSFADPCCAVNEMGGELVMTTDGTPGLGARRSSSGFDLRGNQVVVELTRAPVVGGTNATLSLRRAQDTFIAIQISDPTAVQAQLVLDTVGMTTMDTRTTAERFLRIRETGGRLYWELSADKQTWREVRNEVPTFPVDDVMIVLRVGATMMTNADSVRFDNLNAP